MQRLHAFSSELLAFWFALGNPTNLRCPAPFDSNFQVKMLSDVKDTFLMPPETASLLTAMWPVNWQAVVKRGERLGLLLGHPGCEVHA